HRTTHRPPVRIEPVAADRALRVQLTERQPRRFLRLRRALPKGNTHPLEPPLPRLRMPGRIHLIGPVEQGAGLVIDHRRLAPEVTGTERAPLLNEIADLRAQRRPRLLIQRRDDQPRHGTAWSTLRGSTAGTWSCVLFDAAACRFRVFDSASSPRSISHWRR